jgi:hypothetical protein
MNIYKGVIPAICVLVLVSSAVACNIGVPGPAEPSFEEPFPEESPMEEMHPEEPGFEEPHPEEPPMEEPHPEEPHPEEPQPEEPPPPAPQPQQPQQPQPQQPASGPFTADLAVTDIYPGNQPHGQFHVRITNHGPGTLNNVQVGVSCSSERTDKSTGKLSSGGNANFNLKLGMKPGESQAHPTTLSLDTTVYDYLVGCEIHPGFNDPNPGNNVYNESLK